jgi:hypothetical protein
MIRAADPTTPAQYKRLLELGWSHGVSTLTTAEADWLIKDLEKKSKTTSSLEGKDAGTMSVEQKIEAYRQMHGRDPSPAQIAKLKKTQVHHWKHGWIPVG